MAKHRRRPTLARWTGRASEWDDLKEPTDLSIPVAELPLAEETPGDEDWFSPSDPGDDGSAARLDVSLASMLMLGATSYQRIDGMGMARRALEAASTEDARRDLSDDERLLLTNGRAWCLLVHGDLGHRSRLDDPFVLADAERSVEEARQLAPDNPQGETSLALLRIRQGRIEEALQSAQRAVEAYARMDDHRRDGTTQGGALLAMVTLALALASSGDTTTARWLAEAARAVRVPMDLDEAGFSALMTQLEETVAGSA